MTSRESLAASYCGSFDFLPTALLCGSHTETLSSEPRDAPSSSALYSQAWKQIDQSSLVTAIVRRTTSASAAGSHASRTERGFESIIGTLLH